MLIDMANQTDLYMIHCLTNLHAGSGDSTYGVVDKEVQKDPIEGLPVIHASGLKGAFREVFSYHNNNGTNEIFGADSKADKSGNPAKMSAGKYAFMEARLLFLPVRSSKRPFYLATSKEILNRFLDELDDFGTGSQQLMRAALEHLLNEADPQPGRPAIFGGNGGQVYIDEFTAVSRDSVTVNLGDLPADGDSIALFHHDDLKAVCGRLPVIARNNLDNGISTNLWYEEIVPRHSLFYFFVSRPADHTGFEEQLKSLGHRVQIGGNASVGYGLSKIIKF